MARALFEQLPAVRRLFEAAHGILGYNLARICFEGPAEVLNSTVHSQPALFVAGLAALESLQHNSPETVAACEAAAGLSLGEYTALVFAGAMGFEDGLRVVQCRGEAMQAAADAEPSGMVSILGLDEGAVADLCDLARHKGEILQIANRLCPGNVVISGHTASCDRAVAMADQAGAAGAVRLTVAGAFHTELMQPAVARLSEALAKTPLRTPRIPVVSNVDARPHSDPAEIRELLVRQIGAPVQWQASMEYLIDDGFTQFYEVGPGRVLRGLLKRIARHVPCESVVA
jgi:[acyl-carrier-protein] S-malonyltransferase